jgi:hypothetical protein
MLIFDFKISDSSKRILKGGSNFCWYWLDSFKNLLMNWKVELTINYSSNLFYFKNMFKMPRLTITGICFELDIRTKQSRFQGFFFFFFEGGWKTYHIG